MFNPGRHSMFFFVKKFLFTKLDFKLSWVISKCKMLKHKKENVQVGKYVSLSKPSAEWTSNSCKYLFHFSSEHHSTLRQSLRGHGFESHYCHNGGSIEP